MSPELSLPRLYALRFFYLVVAAGLAIVVWPQVVNHAEGPLTGAATANSLLAGIGLLAVLGLRYPVRMLPLLVFEVMWKAIYLAFYAWPLWRAGQIDEASLTNIQSVLVVVLFVPLMPWRYVVANYVLGSGERWR
jgi:uncharacterized membrane protein YoaK (UPF0700 family)